MNPILDLRMSSVYDCVPLPVRTFQFKDHPNSWLLDPEIC